MNVLLTCVGRRNYLIKYFDDALKGDGQVMAVDNSADAPALQEVKKAFIVPKINDPDYIDVLLEICRTHNIKLLISLNDLELPVLSAAKDLFYEIGTIPVISSKSVIDTCFDKWKTSLFARKLGINVPATYLTFDDVNQAVDSGQVSFPLVVKPRWGTASIGIEYCFNHNELILAYDLIMKRLPKTMLSQVSATDTSRSVMVQEMLKGQEFGLDIFNDLKGNHVCTFVKRKLAMRAGETDKAVTSNNKEMMQLGAIIGKKLKHVGNLDCDVFETEKGLYLLEMNPRFGGGYPFSHVAGANIPAALVAFAKGENPDPSWLEMRPEVTSAKCDRLVIMK